MGLARKLKRKKVLKIVGKCRRCQHAYSEKETTQYCPDCRVDGEILNFKRRQFK